MLTAISKELSFPTENQEQRLVKRKIRDTVFTGQIYAQNNTTIDTRDGQLDHFG
jgi:hypothetical protein